jgi:hypothetical protein
VERRTHHEENPLRKRTSGLIVAGLLAVGSVGAMVITPASATTSANPVTSRIASLKNALSGLVSDGTLTQSQADKVAGTLDSKLPKRGLGPKGDHAGRFGAGLMHVGDAAAKALGLTTDKLHAALRSGKSLADVAKDQKVSVGVLVKAMVTATESELATEVKAGHLTQAQADKIKGSLTQRITDRVNGVRPKHGFGRPGDRRRGPGASNGAQPSSPGGTSGAPTSTI